MATTELPQDFSEVSFTQAEEIVDDNQPDGFTVNERMYDGDHWLDGEGWPQAIDPEADGAAFMQKLIAEMFESKNVVKEVTERFVDGLLDTEPHIDVVADMNGELDDEEEPPDEVQQRGDAIFAALMEWAQEHSFVDTVQRAVRYALLGSRGYLRPFVPPGRKNEDSTIEEPWMDVFSHFFVAAVRPTNAVIYTHPETQRDLSIFHYIPSDLSETTDPGRQDAVERVELSWVDPDDGMTYLRILKEAEDPGSLEEDGELENRQMKVDLNGNLMLQEIDIEQLITEQVRSSQKSLNMTKTMMSHNEVSSGFSEQIFLNAQPPGEWKTDEETGEREFVPNELKRGPMRTHFIQGAVTTDELGQDKLATPKHVEDEPDDPEVFIEGKRSKRMDILDEVSQSFVEMKDQQSGRSRLIARHEFTKTLQKAVRPTRDAIKFTVENVVSLAETFGNDPTTLGDDLRVSVEIFPDSGPLTPEEMKALTTMTENGLMSLRTALSRAGINDIEAEVERIQKEGGERVQRLTERAKLIKQLVKAGATLEGAAKVAGFSEDEAQELSTGFDGSVAQSVSETAGDGAPR